MADDNAEGDLVAAQLKEMQDQIKSLKTKIESAEARAHQAEETVRNAGIVAGSGTGETVHATNHAVIIAGNNFVKNAGINVVDTVGDNYTSCHEAEIIDGHKVISDFVGAECSNIEGKWDRKADLHCEPVVKDFTYDCSVTNSSDVVENNMRKDSICTMSGWAEEHSLQYLESLTVKDFTYDSSVTNSSDVIEDNLRKDSISVQIRQTLSRKQVDLPSVEPTVDPFVDSGESPSSGSNVQNQDGDPHSVDPAVLPPVDYGKTPFPGSGVQNQDCDGPSVSEVADLTSCHNGPVQSQASGAREGKSKRGGNVVRSNVQEFGLKIGYDKQGVDLKILDGRYPPEAGSDSLSSRELESILSSRAGAPSHRNPGHEDHLQEPPPAHVSGDNVASENDIEIVSVVRIVDNEVHQVSVVQVPFNLHKSTKVVDAKRKELSTLSKFGTFIDIDIRTLNVDREADKDSLFSRESIQWIFQVSRPDNGVALAMKFGKATIEDAKVGYKHLKCMLDNPQTTKYTILQDSGECHLRVFTDSSWGKLDNEETVNGNLVFRVDSKGNACLIDWQYYKLTIPVSSPLAGEAVAALDGYNKITDLTVAGYDKQVVNLKMLDGRYPPEAGSDSLSSKELQSILCSGAPSDRNPGHEDHLQEPPTTPTQVSGGNDASETIIENVSYVRIVDNSIHNCSMMVESRSLCDTVKATTTLEDKKKAIVGICALRRAPDIDLEDLKIKWCDATSQVADPLTKGGANPDLLRSVLRLGQLSIVGVEDTELMRRRKECDQST